MDVNTAVGGHGLEAGLEHLFFDRGRALGQAIERGVHAGEVCGGGFEQRSAFGGRAELTDAGMERLGGFLVGIVSRMSESGQEQDDVGDDRFKDVELDDGPAWFTEVRFEVSTQQMADCVFEQVNLAVGLDDPLDGLIEDLELVRSEASEGGQAHFRQGQARCRIDSGEAGQQSFCFTHERLGHEAAQFLELRMPGGFIRAEQQTVDECGGAHRFVNRIAQGLRYRLDQPGGIGEVFGGGLTDLFKGAGGDDHLSEARQLRGQSGSQWTQGRRYLCLGRGAGLCGGWRWGYARDHTRIGSVELTIPCLDSLEQGWMGREQVAPGAIQGIAKEHVAGLLGTRGGDARTPDHPADFLEGADQAIGIAGELHGGGVGQKLALTRDGAFYQAPEEDTDRTEHQQGKANDRQRIHTAVTAATR